MCSNTLSPWGVHKLSQDHLRLGTLVSFNVRQLFSLPLSFMTLAFLSTSQNVLPFEFVCCFFMVKFRLFIFYKNTMEVMLCPSQWIVSRGT